MSRAAKIDHAQAGYDNLPAALTQQVWALALVVGCHLLLVGPALWPSATPGQLLLAAAAGVLNYALLFWLYLTALTTMPVARAATYLTLIPVFGVLGAVLVLGEGVTWLDAAGGVLIVGCLLIDTTADARASRARRERVPRPEAADPTSPHARGGVNR